MELRAEVTGSVWKVLVVEGQEVAEGEMVAILESMKMEIPVTTPQAGFIDSLRVEEGDTVDEGDVVAVLRT